MNAIHRTLCVTALALGFAAAPVHAEFCALDPKPAATLLVPHFQVDLEQAAGLTTTFWVRNVADRPKLVHVHLWTDWGHPRVRVQRLSPGVRHRAHLAGIGPA